MVYRHDPKLMVDMALLCCEGYALHEILSPRLAGVPLRARWRDSSSSTSENTFLRRGYLPRGEEGQREINDARSFEVQSILEFLLPAQCTSTEWFAGREVSERRWLSMHT